MKFFHINKFYPYTNLKKTFIRKIIAKNAFSLMKYILRSHLLYKLEAPDLIFFPTALFFLKF